MDIPLSIHSRSSYMMHVVSALSVSEHIQRSENSPTADIDFIVKNFVSLLTMLLHLDIKNFKKTHTIYIFMFMFV